MTTDGAIRVLDAGGPLFLHEQPPYDPMPACGRGVCVETPSDLASMTEPFVVSLRRMERHDGGPVVAAPDRCHVAVSLATGKCSPRDAAAETWLADHPWIVAALGAKLGHLRERARRLVAQRDRSSLRAALQRNDPGEMLPYDRLFPHDWDLIVAHDRHYYWASDLHCTNPSCSCRDIVVALYDITTRETHAVGQLRIHPRRGDLRSEASSPTASRLLQPLWAKHGAELTSRHHEVRNALLAHTTSCAAAARTADHPGRNAPCPCGSGKKFKRCCALRPDAPSPAQPPR